MRQFDLKDIASSDSSPLIGHFSQGRGDNQHNKYSYTSEFSCIRVAFTERSKANWLMLAWIMWYDAKINRYQYKMMRLPWLVFFIWGQGTIFNTLERSESSRTIFNFLIAIQTFFFNSWFRSWTTSIVLDLFWLIITASNSSDSIKSAARLE